MDFMAQMEALNRPNPKDLWKPWMEGTEMLLATAEDLDKIAEECIQAGIYACDLETTGLDQRAFPNDSGRLETVDKIVGVCIATTRMRGWYIPVRHREEGAEANVPPRLVIAMLQKIQEAGSVAVFHNAKFDHKFLLHDPAGSVDTWDNPATWEDTMILAYLNNMRDKSRGLKKLSKEWLGREMIELPDLFLKEKGKKKKNLDFSQLDPRWEPCIWYACSDAMNTIGLCEILKPLVVEKDDFGNGQSTLYMIEKICITATIWMEQCRIFVDRPKLTELIQLGQAEWWKCINDVYDAVGTALGRDVRPGWVHVMATDFDSLVLLPDYMEVREASMRSAVPDTRPKTSKSVPTLTDPKVRETVDFPPSYDVTIPASLGLMMRELGVKGLVATEKSGQVATRKEILEKVIKDAGEQFGFMKSVKRFREVSKALGSNLFNIYRDSSPERAPDGCVWANFKAVGTDTGRFSTPTPRHKNFMGQVNWNVQSTKAPYYDPKDPPPQCVYRQRECISARPGYDLYAIDYSGVELRIVTNLSGEPKWMAAFFACSTCGHEFGRDTPPPPFCPSCGSDKIGDLHSMTAMSLWADLDPKGDPKLFKMKRQVAKIVNFLLCYGGSGNAVMNSTKCDKEEGWRIKNQFDKAYRGLIKWWRSQEKLLKKQKYVTTVFGRKYPIPDIDHDNRFFVSKAKRNAVNGPVQGSSADIMKLAMGLLYRKFKEMGWISRGPGLPDLVLMTITIHDELVFEIHKSTANVAIPVIEHVMCVDTIKNLGWPIGLKVDIEFGPNWMVPNNLTEMAWNKGGGEWTPELASMLPDFYQRFLANGGEPIDEGAPPPESPGIHPALAVPTVIDNTGILAEANSLQGTATHVAASAQPKPEPTPAAPAPKKPPEKDGTGYVFRVPQSKMSAKNAESLARVLHRCEGRGVDKLHVLDEDGNDLIGRIVKVAYDEFRVIANYEGL